MYTQWYSDILLRRVSAGHICFSSTLKSFVSLTAEGAIPFNAEEFSDPTELRALVELIGPYGIRLLNETWPEFDLSNKEGCLPTTEALARVIWMRLKPHLPLVSLRLYEQLLLWAD